MLSSATRSPRGWPYYSPRILLLTPAMMEQLCAEHETVDTILEELLRQMSGPLLVPTRGRPPLAEITFHVSER